MTPLYFVPKIIQSDVQTGQAIHRWVVDEYTQYERSRLWYVLAIGIAVVLIIYGILSNNFLFSLIVVLAGIILFLQSHQKPLSVAFAITDLGVIVGDRFYPYSELEEFFIIYHPPEVKTLFIETKSSLRPNLRVSLENMNPMDIRSTLRAFLPEKTDQDEEPMSDMVARRWRIL